MTKLSLIIVCILIITAESCKKSNDTEAASCTITTTGLSGAYKLSAAEYKSSSAASAIDLLPFLDACAKDDILTLNTNNTYSNKDAGVTCDPSGDMSGNWSLTGNTLIRDQDSSHIDSYNCKTLVISYSDYETSGDKATFTLTKQ